LCNMRVAFTRPHSASDFLLLSSNFNLFANDGNLSQGTSFRRKEKNGKRY